MGDLERVRLLGGVQLIRAAHIAHMQDVRAVQINQQRQRIIVGPAPIIGAAPFGPQHTDTDALGFQLIPRANQPHRNAMFPRRVQHGQAGVRYLRRLRLGGQADFADGHLIVQQLAQPLRMIGVQMRQNQRIDSSSFSQQIGGQFAAILTCIDHHRARAILNDRRVRVAQRKLNIARQAILRQQHRPHRRSQRQRADEHAPPGPQQHKARKQNQR